jgi:hypothetical protein
VSDAGLRSAYAWAFQKLQDLLDAYASVDSEPFERAEAFAMELDAATKRNPFFKGMKRSLRGAPESADSIILSVLTHVTLALRHGDPMPEAPARELAAAARLVNLPTDSSDSPPRERVIKAEHEGEFAAELGQAFALFSLPALAEIAATAPAIELEGARDELVTFLLIPQGAAVFSPVFGKLSTGSPDPLSAAVMVPALIQFRRQFGEAVYERVLAWARTINTKPRSANWGGRRRTGPVGDPGGGIRA